MEQQNKKYLYPNVLDVLSRLITLCVGELSASKNLFSLREFLNSLNRILKNTESNGENARDDYFRFYNFFTDLKEQIFIILQNLIENYNYSLKEINQYSEVIGENLKKISIHIKDVKKREEYLFNIKNLLENKILDENRPLLDIEDISEEISDKNNYLYYKAKDLFCISGKFQKYNFFIENSLLKWSKNKDWMDFWINKYCEKINFVIKDLYLSRENTKLIFCHKDIGPGGLSLLSPFIVRKVQLDGSLAIMRWRNKKIRIIGQKPSEGNKFIMIYDLNFTGSGIIEVYETLKMNHAQLKAAIVLWDYATNSKKDLEEFDIKLYTIFSLTDLKEFNSNTLDESFTIAPIFLSDIPFLDIIYTNNDITICEECNSHVDVRVIDLFPEKIMVKYCKRCKKVYISNNYESNIEDIIRISAI